jgi:hypothetical protein
MADEQIPAGWYPDPAGDSSKIRYWDGIAWTEHTQAAVNPELQGQEPGAAAYTSAAPYAGVETYTGAETPQQAGAPPTLQPIYAPGQTAPVYAAAAPQAKDRSSMAVASLVLGILSIPCCVVYIGGLFGLLAIVFGCLGIKSSKRGMAIAGFICGVAGVLLLVFVFVIGLAALSDPTQFGLPADAFDDYI